MKQQHKKQHETYGVSFKNIRFSIHLLNVRGALMVEILLGVAIISTVVIVMISLMHTHFSMTSDIKQLYYESLLTNNTHTILRAMDLSSLSIDEIFTLQKNTTTNSYDIIQWALVNGAQWIDEHGNTTNTGTISEGKRVFQRICTITALDNRYGYTQAYPHCTLTSYLP